MILGSSGSGNWTLLVWLVVVASLTWRILRERGRVHTRDLTWDAMSTVARRLQLRAKEQELSVVARRRREVGWTTVIEGLWCGDEWTDVFEPVRRRRVFGSRWVEIQSVQNAAANVGRFLRERPDLAERA